MSDDDLIRRGDALALCDRYPYVEGVRDALQDLPAVTVGVKPPFYFDRYINGVRMAEDVCVERETTLESAMLVAARIASKGPDGEAPVLVYRAPVTQPMPDLSDPVTVHANMLRGTIAKPTVEQIIHLYGREAFQPMIDAAVAKALEEACLAVSEHADWPEDAHGRTEQVGLFARVINAIRAITPAVTQPVLEPVAAPNLKRIGTGLYETQPAPDPALRPTMTDMMVDLNTLDAFMEANPLPPDPAAIREAALREALDCCTDYGFTRANECRDAILALIQKGGDAYAVDPRHAPHEAGPGVTAGATQKGDAE